MSDFADVEVTLKVVALIALATIPMCRFLVKPLARVERASA